MMSEWILLYGDKEFPVSEEWAKKVRRFRVPVDSPSRWYDIETVDGRTVSLLFSAGVPIVIAQRFDGAVQVL